MHHVFDMRTSAPSPTRTGNARNRKRAEGVPRQNHATRRTTVTLSPEAQEIVERFKSASGSSTSAAIDQIIQRSEPKPSRLKEVNGFLVLDVPADPSIGHFTLEDLKQLEDDLDGEYVERFMPRKTAPSTKGKRHRR